MYRLLLLAAAAYCGMYRLLLLAMACIDFCCGNLGYYYMKSGSFFITTACWDMYIESGILFYESAMNFCAGDSNECPFTVEMLIYFRFSKNGHSLCQKKA
jgi:hypothetical protein